jgi:hypothetical protein
MTCRDSNRGVSLRKGRINAVTTRRLDGVFSPRESDGGTSSIGLWQNGQPEENHADQENRCNRARFRGFHRNQEVVNEEL